MKRNKRLFIKYLAMIALFFGLGSTGVLAQSESSLQIVVDGQIFDSLKEYRAYRKEQDQLKAKAEAEAAKRAEEERLAKKSTQAISHDGIPPGREDNPFIAALPDESTWSTVVINPHAEHQKKIAENSVEGQIDQLKQSFDEESEAIENNKIKKEELGKALHEAAGEHVNAMLLVSSEEKLKLYHYDDPIYEENEDQEEDFEPLAVDQHQANVPDPYIEHSAIFEELYGSP